MRAGRLRHRLVLQTKTYTRDSYGAAVVGWQTRATVWGGIEPLTGRELFAQQQIQSEAEVRIVLRHYQGLDETWRISHGGAFYDITEVITPDSRNRMMTLMCRHGVSEDVGVIAGGAWTVLDADGNSFSVTLAVLDSDGNSFTVNTSVLDSDGNSFAVI